MPRTRGFLAKRKVRKTRGFIAKNELARASEKEEKRGIKNGRVAFTHSKIYLVVVIIILDYDLL